MNFIKSALGLPKISLGLAPAGLRCSARVHVSLVHHGIIWKRAKEPQLINYSLSVSSTTGKKNNVLHPNPFSGGIYNDHYFRLIDSARTTHSKMSGD